MLDEGPFGPDGALERAIPITGGLTAEPESVLYVPHETSLPFWVALGLALIFCAALVDGALVAIIGLLVAGVAVIGWTWQLGSTSTPEVRP